jgi:hypothetical protein
MSARTGSPRRARCRVRAISGPGHRAMGPRLPRLRDFQRDGHVLRYPPLYGSRTPPPGGLMDPVSTTRPTATTPRSRGYGRCRVVALRLAPARRPRPVRSRRLAALYCAATAGLARVRARRMSPPGCARPRSRAGRGRSARRRAGPAVLAVGELLTCTRCLGSWSGPDARGRARGGARPERLKRVAAQRPLPEHWGVNYCSGDDRGRTRGASERSRNRHLSQNNNVGEV